MQALAPTRRQEPLTYFHPSGPLGQFFGVVDGPTPRRAVAVIGLGAGSLACYGKPDQRWTFYEIDPTVLRIALNPAYFTFLRDCPPKAFVILGDARLTLVRAPAGTYDVMILDAYSSDAPPMHLITLDAVRLYLTKLAPGGVLLFNISNRHLVLEPVLGAIARAAGLAARTRDDVRVSDAERLSGRWSRNGSRWPAGRRTSGRSETALSGRSRRHRRTYSRGPTTSQASSPPSAGGSNSDFPTLRHRSDVPNCREVTV